MTGTLHSVICKMAYYLKSFTQIIFFVAGSVAVCIAFVVTGEDYKNLLVGADGKDLSWGPSLFRLLMLFHGLMLVAVSFAWAKLTKENPRSIENSNDEPPAIGRSSILIMLLLTVVALISRIINLSSDLWVDEVYTLVEFVRLPMGEILTSFPSQNQHMLYSILARLSFDVFGESAWSLRIPAVLFGVGSIWALYLLSLRLLGSRVAFFASALMTVSYHHVWFSQNARGYTGLLFFTLVATWLWIESLRYNTVYLWVLYSASVVIGMWTHMTMAFVVASHGIVYLILLIKPSLSGRANVGTSLERRARLAPIFAWMISVSFTLQLYALSLPEFLSVGLHEESKDSLWTNPIWVITETLQSLSIGFAGIVVVLCGGAFLAYGWFCLFKENRRAAVLTVLPPVLAGSFMLILGHNLFPRFFFFAMGFGILIVIKGALELPKTVAGYLNRPARFGKMPEFVGLALVILLITASVITVPRNYALPKQDYSGAKLFVESNRLPGEEIVAVSLAGAMYGKYFAPDWTVAETDEQLKNIQKSNPSVILVYTLSPEIKAFHPQLWEIIESDYRIIKVFPGTLNGGEVVVCRKRSANVSNNNHKIAAAKPND